MDFKNTKVRIALVVAAILLLAGTFTAGRFSRPAKVEIKETFKEKIVEVVDQKAITEAVSKAKLDWKKSEKDRTVIKTVYKEGKIVERIVYRDKDTSSSGSSDTASSNASTVSSTTSTTKETEKTKEKTVTAQTLRFRGGLGVGTQWDKALKLNEPKSFVYEAHAEVRILGGLWGGISTVPQLKFVGLTLSFQY